MDWHSDNASSTHRKASVRDLVVESGLDVRPCTDVEGKRVDTLSVLSRDIVNFAGSTDLFCVIVLGRNHMPNSVTDATIPLQWAVFGKCEADRCGDLVKNGVAHANMKEGAIYLSARSVGGTVQEFTPLWDETKKSRTSGNAGGVGGSGETSGNASGGGKTGQTKSASIAHLISSTAARKTTQKESLYFFPAISQCGYAIFNLALLRHYLVTAVTAAQPSYLSAVCSSLDLEVLTICMSYSRESCETFPLCIHGTSLTFAAVALADLVFVAKYYENAFDVGDRRRTISSPPRKPRLRSDVSGLPMANKGASLECRTLLREWLEKMDQLVTWLQAPPPDSQKLYRNCAKSSRLPALVKFHKFVRTHFERELIDGSDSRVTGSIEWLLEFRRFLSGRQSKIRSVGTSGTASPPTNAVAAASSQSEGEMGPPKEPYRSPKLAAEQSSSSSVVTKEAPASVMLPLPSPSSSSSSSSSSEDAALAAKKSDYRRVTDGRGGYWMVPKKPRDQTYTVKKSGSRPPSSTSPVPTSARVVPASSSSSPKPAAPSTVAGISNSSQANTSSSMDVSVPGGEDRHSNRRDGCDATVAVEFHATTPSLGDVVDHQIMMDPAEESLAMLVDGAEYDSSRRHELIAAMAHFDHHATVQSMLPFTSIADVPPFDSQGQDHEGFFDDGYSSGFSDDTSPLSPPLTPIGQFDGTYSTTASTGTTGLMSLSSATPSSSLHSSSSLRKSPRSQPALSLDDGQDSSSRQQLTSSFSSNDADSRSRLRMLQALDDESRRVISTDSLRNPEDDVPIDRTIHHRHHEETMTTSASSDEGTTTHDDDDDGEETVAELQVCGDSSNSMEVDEASASLANAVSDQSPCQSRVMASRHAVAAATMAERSHPIANSISLRGWTIIGPPAGHVYW